MAAFNVQEHNRWLSLLEISGPFLSTRVLGDAFPQGLDRVEPEVRRRLRSAYGQWSAEMEAEQGNQAIYTDWIYFVLAELLGMEPELASSGPLRPRLLEGPAIPAALSLTVKERATRLLPDYALCDQEDRGRLLVVKYPYGQDLSRAIAHQPWPATPADGMVQLLRGTGVLLGLVTNGEQWMLVYAPPRETTSYISWYAHLWLEEPLTLQAMRSLLHLYRFFNAPEDQTLPAMLAASIDFQQDVTDQLGFQVRHAVDVLLRAFDRIEKDFWRTGDPRSQRLASLDGTQLYEAALTVMMRLVILLFAEERKLLPSGERLYDEHYAASTLLGRLIEVSNQRDESFLEQKCDAWSRLLSLFRLIHDGASHQDLNLRAYDGRLFDPDRFPFLEGRAPGTCWRDTVAHPLPISNRTVLHLLHALQFLEGRTTRSEARRLSFRALDIEQIGHVYEGLLDHTARRAQAPLLGLRTAGSAQDEGKELALETLERCREERGEEGVLALLEEETGYKRERLTRELAKTPDRQALDRLRAACENDEELFARVQPFAGLLRTNTFEEPVVILAGSLFMTQGPDRRTTGTHYTPRALTEPMVEHALKPLLLEGLAEGKDESECHLLSPVEILNLKVCDMAMGSGAFLVQACRYLAQWLLESWRRIEESYPERVIINPEGRPIGPGLDEIAVPLDPEERESLARRLVAERCLYGVDKNPLAVEMAKLSLWLITLSKDRPFTFLDHALRSGDSLLGVDLEQLRAFSLKDELEEREHRQVPLAAAWIDDALRIALASRARLRALYDDTLATIEHKRSLLRKANEATDLLRLGADMIILTTLAEYAKRPDIEPTVLMLDYAGLVKEYEHVQRHPNEAFEARVQERYRAMRAIVTNLLSERTPFHWFLELPEAFLASGEHDSSDRRVSGFDALVSNPPFQGGQRITGALSRDYREYLVENLAHGKRGSADISAYFFLRATSLVRPQGQCALLATNTIAQGDTREVGLDQIIANGWTIPRATPSVKWPGRGRGKASLEIAQIWLRNGAWQSQYFLEEQPVNGAITSYLTPPGAIQGKPYVLAANENKSFIGSYVLGLGFVLQPEEAQALIQKDPRNRDVLFPYLNGEDVNSRPDQSPSRWVINFFDWPLAIAETYPDCMHTVREKVKPQREQQNDRVGKQYWWRFLRTRPELHSAIADRERVLVIPRVSKYMICTWEPTGIVSSEQTCVIATESDADFALIQCTFHDNWTRQQGSTLETRMRYTPSDCFETFPFPLAIASLEAIGERYYQHRQKIMQARQEGLTATYNRFHNPREEASDIRKWRELHREMDEAVAAAYGWHTMALEHGFHETRQGLRYTISEEARHEVLDRLLTLNHERYAEEVAMSLHEKETKARGTPSTATQGRNKGKGTDSTVPRTKRDAGQQTGAGKRRKLAEHSAAYEADGQDQEEMIQQSWLEQKGEGEE